MTQPAKSKWYLVFLPMTCMVMTGALVFFFAPKLEAVYADMGVELPTLTAAVLDMPRIVFICVAGVLGLIASVGHVRENSRWIERLGVVGFIAFFIFLSRILIGPIED